MPTNIFMPDGMAILSGQSLDIFLEDMDDDRPAVVS
jgi:hypothetical protein